MWVVPLVNWIVQNEESLCVQHMRNALQRPSRSQQMEGDEGGALSISDEVPEELKIPSMHGAIGGGVSALKAGTEAGRQLEAGWLAGRQAHRRAGGYARRAAGLLMCRTDKRPLCRGRTWPGSAVQRVPLFQWPEQQI